MIRIPRIRIRHTGLPITGTITMMATHLIVQTTTIVTITDIITMMATHLVIQTTTIVTSVVDPELLPGSGSGIKVPYPDPAKSERAYK